MTNLQHTCKSMFLMLYVYHDVHRSSTDHQCQMQCDTRKFDDQNETGTINVVGLPALLVQSYWGAQYSFSSIRSICLRHIACASMFHSIGEPQNLLVAFCATMYWGLQQDLQTLSGMSPHVEPTHSLG